MEKLRPRPLTAHEFAPYGEVIELNANEIRDINHGMTKRYHDLCKVDCQEQNGRVGISIFRTNPVQLPFTVEYLERHPLGSQAFIPMEATQFLVLVAPKGETIAAEDLELFITDGTQGINFHKNTWHHTHLIIANSPKSFAVIDRLGDEENLVEQTITGSAVISDN